MKKYSKLSVFICIILCFSLMIFVVGCNKSNGDNSSSNSNNTSRLPTPSSSSQEQVSSSSQEQVSSSSQEQVSSSSQEQVSSSSQEQVSSSSQEQVSSSSQEQVSSSSEEEGNGGNALVIETDAQTGIEYALLENSEGYLVYSLGSYTSATLEIPTSFNEKSVIGIYEGAFSNNTSLTTVFIPTTILTIGDGAFSGMTALSRVYYKGSYDQWQNVGYVASSNESLNSQTLYYYSATQPEEATTVWNFWYYSGSTVKEWEVFSGWV